MTKPLIGITCFSLDVTCARSAINQRYVDAVVAAGGAPIGIPIGVDDESLERVYSMVDGLLLPGGDDVAPERYGEARDPHLGDVDDARDTLELTLTRWALQDGLPVLGICRGMQVIAVASGGTLYQDLPTQLHSNVRHEVREFGRDHLTHPIILEPGSRLASVLGCSIAQVNSLHHQAVSRVPEGFVVSARSSDGLVEGIEATGDRFVLGVQCHPEEIWDRTAPEFARLFRVFVEVAAERAAPLRTSA